MYAYHCHSAPGHALKWQASHSAVKKLARMLARATIGEDLRSCLLSNKMLNPGKTPTKTYARRSTVGNTCRFCSVPLVSETGKHSSSVPIISATRREQCKGAKMSELLSQLGIVVEELETKSKLSCPKCAWQIFCSHKFESESETELKLKLKRQL